MFILFSLPLRDKRLKQWIHKIGRVNLPINSSTRVCSRHFLKVEGRKLRKDEVPTENIPILRASVTQAKKRRSPKKRMPLVTVTESNTTVATAAAEAMKHSERCDKGIATELSLSRLNLIMDKVQSLERTIETLQQQLKSMEFRLSNISHSNELVTFYTGFPSYACLEACFKFLGSDVNHLHYNYSKKSGSECSDTTVSSSNGRPHKLPPIEEFFLVLVRLRLGLMEQDLACRFGISQSTVSRITTTWINFLYIKFKEITLWPRKEVIVLHMPNVFKEQYPSTRVIIDATEVFIEQPHLPELQKMTFSSYKNHNTYKALIGISPNGAITFVSELFSGAITDKELTKRSGILELLESGDSVMADKGFDIAEYLIPLGVKLNIPPFLRRKEQFSHNKLVEIRRIASLRIHVERAIGRIYLTVHYLVRSQVLLIECFMYVVLCATFILHYAHNLNKQCTL